MSNNFVLKKLEKNFLNTFPKSRFSVIYKSIATPLYSTLQGHKHFLFENLIPECEYYKICKMEITVVNFNKNINRINIYNNNKLISIKDIVNSGKIFINNPMKHKTRIQNNKCPYMISSTTPIEYTCVLTLKLFNKNITIKQYFQLEESELRFSKSFDDIRQISEVKSVPCMARQIHKAASSDNYEKLKLRLSKRTAPSSNLQRFGVENYHRVVTNDEIDLQQSGLMMFAPKTNKLGMLKSKKLNSVEDIYQFPKDRPKTKLKKDYKVNKDKNIKTPLSACGHEILATKHEDPNKSIEDKKFEEVKIINKPQTQFGSYPNTFPKTLSGLWSYMTGNNTNQQWLEYINDDNDDNVKNNEITKDSKNAKDSKKKKRKKK